MTRHLKFVIFIIAALAAGLVSCGSEKTEKGVSLELAQQRKKQISNLRYELHFDIPASDTITGSETVRFDYNGHGDVVMDFRQPESAVKSLTVNGQPDAWRHEPEHIVISGKNLKATDNEIRIDFTPGERSLNRNPDYLYTLFVPDRARTVFPCFDQPDMKASYRLTLTVPGDWEAVTNTKVESVDSVSTPGRKTIKFGATEPLSTYLFAFAAGKFQRAEYNDGKRTIGAYYRETEPDRIAQLPEIMKQVCDALDWQEEFTQRSYPFAKYDLVILPGFQFGGMEHTGATFYNDNTIFLGKNPTPDDELKRASLIAHETTHMWFGDYVTMAWFDDVWTKEVFANYFAAAITRELLPDLDHDLEWIRNYAAAAMSEDRGEGGTSIRQKLGNLNDAGLVYNNIIYNKAPIMMEKLVEIMGKEAFREGIRKYVATFPYGNATWDELVDILQSVTTADVKGFSQVWVYEKGMPHIHLSTQGGDLVVEQTDPNGKGNLWPQQFKVIVADRQNVKEVQVKTDGNNPSVRIPLGFNPDPDRIIIPNSDGKGYGLFLTDNRNMRRIATWLKDAPEGVKKITRLASLMNLNENYLDKTVTSGDWLQNCLEILRTEEDPQTAATVAGYLAMPHRELGHNEKIAAERQMWTLARTHPLKSTQKTLLNLLMQNAETPQVCDSLYSMWKGETSPLLDERNYMQAAYQLAIRYPERADSILATQRARLTNPDRIREFDFVSRAAVSDEKKLDELFDSFVNDPEARKIEPWTRQALALLNHPLRGDRTLKYIRPGLDALENIQQTGDIFFPGNWCNALLWDHRSPEAMAIVSAWLDEHPDLKPLLRNKILNGAYPMLRANR